MKVIKSEIATSEDLFDSFNELPDMVKDIIDAFSEGECDYESCKLLVLALNEVGYTCDYGLDGNPHSLKKIGR